MIHLMEDIEGLTNFQKHTMITRYVSIVENIRFRSKYYSVCFHVGRAVVTVGSLIVPALLSIQYSGPAEAISYAIYWVTWIVSLLVTTFNGVLTLFKIDKKYYFLHTTLEQLKSEAWQYIHLSGRYGGYYAKGLQPTHQNQYIYFCHNIEKIKLKQVEEEYYKWLDAQQPTNTAVVDVSGASVEKKESKTIAGLYTPTPDTAQLLNHQQQIANALLKAPFLVDGGYRTPQAQAAQDAERGKEKKPAAADVPVR